MRAGEPLPPELRISRIDNKGSLKVKLTNGLKFPSDIQELIESEDPQNTRRILKGRSSRGSIQTYAVHDDGHDYKDERPIL